MKKLTFLFTYLSLIVACQAGTIYVDDDGPADFNNIQAAINYANDGDIIEVQPGTYTGSDNRDIDFLGKAITVQSTDPNEPCVVAATVIDCQGSVNAPHRGFYFHSGEGPNSVVSGLTITNGVGPTIMWAGFLWSVGGGIFCDSSGPTISRCNITGNAALLIDGGSNYWYGSHGGGIFCFKNSNPTIKYCTITNNFAGGGHQNYGTGGGISCDGITWHSDSSPTIISCTITDNSTPSHTTAPVPGGGGLCLGESAKVINCIISRNSSSRGGGIYIDYECDPNIRCCTIADNFGNYGSGIYASVTEAKIGNCILWNNSGSQIIGSPLFLYCDIQDGWPGTGNIDADPCFADPCSGDYHLKSQAGRWDPNSQTWIADSVSSPCIDAGNPGYPLGDEPSDANNVRINMGAYGGTAKASKTPPDWRSIADLTNDWSVDFNDLAGFVSYWLNNGQCIPSDLTRNEAVNFTDYAVFANNWLWQ